MSYLKEALNTPVQEKPKKLRELSKNTRAVQESTLFDILEISQDTEFGKSHNFGEIKTLEDFKREVPISDFDDYKETVEKLKDGAENLLFPGKTTRFIVTSGTTAFPKYIPHTQLSEDLLKDITFLRQLEIFNIFPSVADPNSKGISIVNPSSYEDTKGGIPTGSASGQAAKNPNSNKMVPPLAVNRSDLGDLHKTDYLTMLFAARERNINTLGCNDAGHMNTLMRVLNEDAESIIEDIREGKISVEIPEELESELLELLPADPERAEEIEKIYKEKGKLEIADLWPNFGFVICWLSSSVGRFAKEYRDLFPENTLFMDAGYGSSEGKFNVPTQPNSPKGLPVVYGFFFEFLPLDGGDTVTLDETVDGKLYELIITSYSGFYRYNMHDLVVLSTNDEGLKEIEFIGKTKDKISLDDKTLYAGELTKYIEAFEAANDTFIRFYQGTKDKDGLILKVEPRDSGMNFNQFESFIKENLENKGYPVSAIIELPQGTRDAKLQAKIAKGQKRNQMKTLVFED